MSQSFLFKAVVLNQSSLVVNEDELATIESQSFLFKAVVLNKNGTPLMLKHLKLF